MKRGLYQLVLRKIELGMNPAKICKTYNLNKKSVQNVVGKLKRQGIIKKIGYAVWEVDKQVLNQVRQLEIKKTSHQIRGHAFNWKIRFLRQIDWIKRLEKYSVPYKLVGFQQIPRIIIDNKKIWLTKKGMIIYETKDFFANNSFSSKGKAVYELDRLIKKIGRKLEIDLTPYKFTTLREHFALIKNELARQYNNKKEKLYIKDDGGIWMWIDHSEGEHELESNEVILNKKIQDWYNDQKKTNFEVTPSFILTSINTLTQNQLIEQKNKTEYAKDLVEHKNAIKVMSKNTDANTKTIELFAEIVKDLSNDIKELKEKIR
jgi:hypothetical protein